eukprot:8954864-Karenia_brevis.AAC.1
MVRHAVRSTPGSSILAKEDASDRRQGHLHRGQGVRNFLLGQRQLLSRPHSCRHRHPRPPRQRDKQ